MFHRLVRPCLDGLSLLVFLYALVTAIDHMGFRGCDRTPSAVRQELVGNAMQLEQLELQHPGSLQAALGDDQPLTALRAHVPGRRLKILDPWDRPLVLRPLVGEWLFELRCRGQDGRLDTADDQFFWMSRAGDVTFDHQLADRHVPTDMS